MTLAELTQIDLNRLRVFYFTVEEMSFLRAAKKLNVTPSAISQQIKLLETELNTQLFVRGHRSISSTPAGKQLQTLLGSFFAELRETVEVMEKARREPTGILRVGAPQIIGSEHLIDIIGAFTVRYPKIQFHLTLNLPMLLIDRLLANQLDLAILDAGDVFSRLHPIATRPLLQERQILVGSKPLCQRIRRPFSFESLAECTFLSHVPEATEVKFWFKRSFGKIPGTLSTALSCGDTRGLVRAAQSGYGLALLPVYLVAPLLQTGKLVQIPTQKPDYLNQISLAQLPGKKPSLAEREFLKFLTSEMKKREDIFLGQ